MPRTSAWTLIALLAAAVPARSQGTEDVNAGQFDFSLPGARSLGMGGSFIALADDATSAYSNPAGLIQLGRPEVSIEYRGWDFEATAIDRGHAFGTPTGTVTFTWFSTKSDCSGPSTGAGTISLDANGVAHPSTAFGPLAAGSYSLTLRCEAVATEAKLGPEARCLGGGCDGDGPVELFELVDQPSGALPGEASALGPVQDRVGVDDLVAAQERIMNMTDHASDHPGFGDVV
jgi:hypothetical protein